MQDRAGMQQEKEGGKTMWIDIDVFIHTVLFDYGIFPASLQLSCFIKTARLASDHRKDSPAVEECLPK